MTFPKMNTCATCATGAPLRISTGADNENNDLSIFCPGFARDIAPLGNERNQLAVRHLRHWCATGETTGADNENNYLAFEAQNASALSEDSGKIEKPKSLILLCATGGRRISYGNYTTGASLSTPNQVPQPVAVGAKAPLTRASTLALVPRESKPLRRGSGEPQALAQTPAIFSKMERDMTHPKRPRRQRKGDRLLNPDATKAQIETDHALAPFDRLATEMEILWGIDQLPALVSPALAQKYGAAIAYLNECIANADPDATRAAAENCAKGLRAMDAEARANGATPATGDFWEYELTGDGVEPFRFAVMRDGAEWQTAHAKRPDLRMFTMREVAMALQAYCNAVPLGEVKDAFPGATITRISPELSAAIKAGGDPIPF